MIKKCLVFLIVVLSLNCMVFGQYKSVNLSLYGSNYLDGIKDQSYDYEIIYDGNLFQFALGYSNNISPNISLNNSLGISVAEGIYENFQTQVNTGSSEERTYIRKEKRITFFKIGTGVSYWFNSLGKGAFFKGDLRLNMLISANSVEEKKVDDDPIQRYDLTFKDELKAIVPTFVLGAGYNLFLSSKFYINAGLYVDIRAGSYFRDTDQYNFLNRGLEFGFGFLISK